MKILYNPPVPNGAPIGRGYNDFIFNGSIIDSLLPGEIKQYEDAEADEILDVFTFIQEVTAEQAQKLMEKPREKELKCDQCDFSTDTKIALISHKKKHEKEAKIAEETAGIPKASSEKLEEAPDGSPLVNPNAPVKAKGEELLPNVVDKDGVEWYGEGKKESRGSMQPTTKFNQGRFGGQPLTDK